MEIVSATFFGTADELRRLVEGLDQDQDPTFEWGGKEWSVRSIRTQRDGAKLQAVVVQQ